MPSFLNKLLHPSSTSSTRNPYIDPNHPHHSKTAAPATAAPTSTQAFRSPPPRPASPREQRDFLAEARQAIGRDPVSGRPLTSPGGREQEAKSVYQETSERTKKTSGTKYDLFVQEMRERRRGVWRRPEGGFYAPERRVGEFYRPETGSGYGQGQGR